MLQTDLAYLAGIFDGEGCFYARLVNRKNYTGGNIEVRVAVQANSMAMIMKIKAIYDELGIVPCMDMGRMQPLGTRLTHKISVHRKSDVDLILTSVLPYLVVKKPEAEMILGWLTKWGHDMRGISAVSKARPSYDERVIFVNQLSAAKKVA